MFFPTSLTEKPNDHQQSTDAGLYRQSVEVEGGLETSWFSPTPSPDVLQGRVSSVVRLFTFSGPPLGLALTGVLLEAIGIVPTILIYACFFLLIAGAAALNTHVRHAPPLTKSQAEKQ